MERELIMKTRYILSFVALFTALFFSDKSQAETIIGETTLLGEVKWESTGNPYRIQGDITIAIGASLTVYPGCQIIFEGNYGFLVNGTLKVEAYFSHAQFQGMDLGDGKHVLWKGIVKTDIGAIIRLHGAEIQDCEIAVDFSQFAYLAQSS